MTQPQYANRGPRQQAGGIRPQYTNRTGQGRQGVVAGGQPVRQQQISQGKSMGIQQGPGYYPQIVQPVRQMPGASTIPIQEDLSQKLTNASPQVCFFRVSS